MNELEFLLHSEERPPPPLPQLYHHRRWHRHDVVEDGWGAYRIVRLIGYGSFGAVYEVQDMRRMRRVALKERFSADHIKSYAYEFAVLPLLGGLVGNLCNPKTFLGLHPAATITN